MIVNHDLTLRLRWSRDGSREISVPVEYRRGAYSGRYELFVDGVHIGWVVKHNKLWHGYLAAEQNVYRLGNYARTNVLAQHAEIAYA